MLIDTQSIKNACKGGKLSLDKYAHLFVSGAKSMELGYILKRTGDWKNVPTLLDMVVKSPKYNEETRLAIAESFLRRANKLFMVVSEQIKPRPTDDEDEFVKTYHLHITNKLLCVGELRIESVIYNHIDNLYTLLLTRHKRMHPDDLHKTERLSEQINDALSAFLTVFAFR